MGGLTQNSRYKSATLPVLTLTDINLPGRLSLRFPSSSRFICTTRQLKASEERDSSSPEEEVQKYEEPVRKDLVSEDVVNDDGVGGAQNHSSDEDAIDEPRVLSPSQVIDAPAQEGETFVDPFILELFHAINQKVARKWVDFNVDVSGFHFSSKQKKLVQRDLPKKQRFVPQYFPSRWNDFVQAIESYEGFVHKKGRFGSRFTHPEFKVGTPHLI